MTQTKIKWVLDVSYGVTLNSCNEVNNLKQEILDSDGLEVILDSDGLELLLEGGVVEHLLVLPDLVHGDLLQGSGVMNGCRENKIRFYPEKKC